MRKIIFNYQFLMYMYLKQHSVTWLASHKIRPHVLPHKLPNAVWTVKEIFVNNMTSAVYVSSTNHRKRNEPLSHSYYKLAPIASIIFKKQQHRSM